MTRRGAAIVSVIGSGWSLAGIDLARIPGLRIGVNDSCWRTRVDMGVTMDRLYFEGRHQQLARAFPSTADTAFYYRKGIDKGGIALEGWVGFDCDHTSVEMSRDWSPRTRLNGLNSGICAINLAFRINPDRVILWGFDMCRAPGGAAYYHEPYPWAKAAGATSGGKYDEWRRHFPKIREQFDNAGIGLFNASSGSVIDCLPRVDPQRWLT